MWKKIGLLIALLLLCANAEAAVRTTLHNAAQAVANGTNMTVDDKGAAGVTITGTFVGTLSFEGSADGAVTFSAVTCTEITSLVSATTATTTGQYQCPVAGLSHFRARISAYTSGSITAIGTASNGSLGSVGGSGTISNSGCMPSAAAPTYVESVINYLSCTLAGALRATLETLLAGEDMVNNLLMVSGGNVRGSVGNVASGLLIAADCTLHCTPAVVVALPTGSKTFTSTIVSATSGDTLVKQTHKIYGANISTFTDDDAVLLCTNTFTATTQYLTKKFTMSCAPVTANFLFYGVISSATGSGAGVVTGDMTATY